MFSPDNFCLPLSSGPWSINCQAEALPIVTFYFRYFYFIKSNNFLYPVVDSCVVDMTRPPENRNNQLCMKEILNSYQLSSSNNVYFIWLTHGQGAYGECLEDLKDSYFKRYPRNSGLVLF